MYYSPPKKSVWGHSLRKMEPAVERERVEAFLSRAVSNSVFATGSVFYVPTTFPPSGSPELYRHFGRLLGLSEPQPGLSNLSEEQFELCFSELLERPSLFEPGRGGATVTAFYTISAWNVEGSSVETSSTLGVYYGGKPRIIPGFAFDTMEVFEYLQGALQAVGLGKLNPKHIKGRKP
ncbi:MAG: hypothetical protein LJE95_05205 [Acidobacteria bacterium]|nr:hypothetical protein [Acidobacteriota bacterium]